MNMNSRTVPKLHSIADDAFTDYRMLAPEHVGSTVLYVASGWGGFGYKVAHTNCVEGKLLGVKGGFASIEIANGFVIKPITHVRCKPLYILQDGPVYAGDRVYGNWRGAASDGYIVDAELKRGELACKGLCLTADPENLSLKPVPMQKEYWAISEQFCGRLFVQPALYANKDEASARAWSKPNRRVVKVTF